MGMKACETFREVDNLFINYKTNEKQFSSDSGLYYQYCPVKRGSKRCNTDYEKLKAISEYGFRELAKNDKVNLDSGYDPSADFVFMGWCHRLYKISKDHNSSLNQSYGNNLGKSRGDFNYQGILNNKKHLMDSNISIMNMFYLLFQQICKTINTYETCNLQPHQYINSATQFYIIYNKLSNFVNQCGPYLRLLNHLKTIYDEYIKAVIKDNSHNKSLSSQLIELSSIDKTKFGSESNSTGCNRVHQMLEKKISRPKNEPQEEEEEEDELSILMELLVSDDDEDANGDDLDNANGGDSEKKFDIIENIDNTSKNHETDPGNSLDQSNIPNDGPHQPERDTTDNTDDSNDKEQTKHKQEQTLDNSQSSDKSPENSSDEQLPKETTQENQDTTKEDQDTTKEGQDTTKEDQDSTQEISLTKKESIIDIPQSMKPAASLLKSHLLSNTLTDTGNNAYEKTLQTLQNASSKLTELDSDLDKAISQPNKETVTPPAGDNGLKPGDSGGDPPSSDDPSVDPPSAPHISKGPQTEPTKQSEPEHKQDEDPQEKGQQSALTIQGPSDGSINTPYVQVTKQDNSVNHINGIISKSVISMDILKKHKLIAFSVIGIAILITLAIMYKYLSPWRTKKSKGKTKMKKIINLVEINKTKKTVINSINGKRPMQIIINSSGRKKQIKKSITSVYGKNFPLLNIYKLMEADPLPFINLFFLLIFLFIKELVIL